MEPQPHHQLPIEPNRFGFDTRDVAEEDRQAVELLLGIGSSAILLPNCVSFVRHLAFKRGSLSAILSRLSEKLPDDQFKQNLTRRSLAYCINLFVYFPNTSGKMYNEPGHFDTLDSAINNSETLNKFIDLAIIFSGQ